MMASKIGEKGVIFFVSVQNANQKGDFYGILLFCNTGLLEK